MPKKPPANAEQVRISPEDADVLDFFIVRRSYNTDGTLRYVQLIGDATEIDQFASNQPISITTENRKQRATSLARIIMQRKLGRPLAKEEFVTQINGQNGDVRRQNLELASRSELASVTRDHSWSSTGQKYLYADSSGRYYATKGDVYLGTYDTLEQAKAALEMFNRLIAAGMSEDEASRRIKSRSRNTGKIVID